MEFKNASKWQCEQLFKNFFPSSDDCFASSSSVPPSERPTENLSLEDIEIPGLTCEPLSADSPASGKGKGKEVVIDDAPLLSLSPSASTCSLDAFPPTPTQRAKNAPLDPVTLSRLAKQFAAGIPQGEFSIAALQGCTSLSVFFCFGSLFILIGRLAFS